MKIKAKCINDFRAPKRRNNGIKFGMVYTIVKFIGDRPIGIDGKVTLYGRVETKEFPGVWYVPRRFEILDKEINLTLPDDLNSFPL